MKRPEVLDAAKAVVTGEREQQYGSPENNFKTIARLWEIYLKTQCVSEEADVCVRAHDVAIMMSLLKIARIASGRKHDDNYVDACGYFACAAELAEGEG